jgi:hypothetical protein
VLHLTSDGGERQLAREDVQRVFDSEVDLRGIELVAVSKRFGNVEVIADLSLEVATGE